MRANTNKATFTQSQESQMLSFTSLVLTLHIVYPVVFMVDHK